MELRIEDTEIQRLVAEIATQLFAEALDWPAGRIALTEAEAAAACGVARHVLRDLRLQGRIRALRLGRKVVYTRQLLLAGLHEIQVPVVNLNHSNSITKRSHHQQPTPTQRERSRPSKPNESGE